MTGFLDNLYNMDTLRGTLISDQAWQASWNLAVTASTAATVTAHRLPGLIKDMQLAVVQGGPHAIPWIHAGEVSTALLDFLGT